MGEGDGTDKTRGKSPAASRAAGKAAPPAERRLYRTASLGELLPAITRPAYRRRSPATAGLLDSWARVVGQDLAAISAPRRCTGGTLTIACAGPAALEIQHRSQALIERANRVLGPGTVARLRIVQEEPAAPLAGPAPRRRVPPPPVSLPELPEGPLRAALERLGGHLARRQGRA